MYMNRAPAPIQQAQQTFGIYNNEVNFDQLNDQMNEQMDYFGDIQANQYGGEVRQNVKFIKEFTNVQPTKEYKERQYYNNSAESFMNLIVVNKFWVELARHIVKNGLKAPFLTSNFIYACKNHTEMIACLTFIGLPFVAKDPILKNLEGKSVQIEAVSNQIIFYKEIREGSADLKPDILISQRYFDPKDRYTFSDDDPDLKLEKDVQEFIIDKIYLGQVIVTNCSMSRQEFNVLVEMPEGSMPVIQQDYTKSYPLSIEAYTTQKIEYNFYFPSDGNFKVYAANVSRNGIVVAVAQERFFEVHKERTTKKLETIEEILSMGSKDDILKFVATKNILNPKFFNFSDIYYLLRDKEFFVKFTDTLRKRKIYDNTTWSYCLYHGEPNTFKEFMEAGKNNANFAKLIHFLKTPYVSVDTFTLKEYSPLINARIHMLSESTSNILNVELREQYRQFLNYLAEVPKPNSMHFLCLTYYMLLQDRITDAINIFKQIDAKEIETVHHCVVQYDYFAAYLDFFIGYPNFKVARDICDKYLDYPLLSWRSWFYEISNQIAEYDGEVIAEEQKDKLLEEKKKEKGAVKEEILMVELDGEKFIVTHQNITEIKVSYYLIDLEVLFSRNPFLLEVTMLILIFIGLL